MEIGYRPEQVGAAEDKQRMTDMCRSTRDHPVGRRRFRHWLVDRSLRRFLPFKGAESRLYPGEPRFEFSDPIIHDDALST